ncbi:ABC transporter permease [candidate division KSB1 bacterium]
MVYVLALKEIRENLLSLKFYLVIILSGFLVLVSGYLMSRDYIDRLADYNLLKPDAGEARAIIPPSPMSIFVRGMDRQIGTAYDISFAGQIEVGSSQQSINRVFGLFATPDLLYIIQVVLSLAAMLFAYDRISGERESRTLPLLLSGSLSRAECILGKWLGGLVSFFVPLVVALIIGLTVVLIVNRIDFSGADLIRLAVILIIGGLYLTFFFSLGLFTSVRASGRATSLVVALFLWVLLVFIVPGMARSFAGTLRPLPTSGQIEMRRYHIWVSEIFNMIAEQKSDNPSPGKIGDIFRAIDRGNQEITDDYRPKLVARSGLTVNITRLSPTGSLVLAATDLAGTGRQEMVRLVDEVISYKNRVFAVDPGYNINRPTDKPIPVFSHRRVSASEAFGRETWLDILLLAAWLLIGFSLAYVGFIRADVR